MAAFREAVRLEPNDVDFRGNLAVGLLGKRAWADAIVAMNEVLRLDPKRADVLSDLAWQLANCPDEKLRNPARAIELAGKAVELQPADPGCWNAARHRPLPRRRLAGGRGRPDQGDGPAKRRR